MDPDSRLFPLFVLGVGLVPRIGNVRLVAKGADIESFRFRTLFDEFCRVFTGRKGRPLLGSFDGGIGGVGSSLLRVCR